MITKRISVSHEYVVEREQNGRWAVITRATDDYATARAWAHAPGTRVVMVQTRRFVCEDGQ